MADSKKQATPRHRSPSYPSFSLDTALVKARKIYDLYKRSTTSAEKIFAALGYRPTTSHAARALSALIQYGLLEETRNGENKTFNLTELSLGVLLRGKEDEERLELVRSAAVKPTLYAKVAEKWPAGLPTDEVLSNYLLFTKKFNPEVVQSVIRNLRETWRFAKWSVTSPAPVASVSATQENPRNTSARGKSKAPSASPPVQSETQQDTEEKSPELRCYRMPFQSGREAVLNLPPDVTAAEIDLLARYISVIRDAISPQE